MMDAVEEVKSRLNIEDVIGEYVVLKRSGRNFKGLSPFTNEKSPSFMVSPEKQIWHDFSSGRGGNIFSFVMEMEGLEFRGALELLARKAGVELEKFRPGSAGQAKAKERTMAALNDAANFYQRCLTKNQIALEYVRNKRAFSKETILEFRLGYSPESGELTKFLLGKDYTAQELKNAGLSTERRGGLSDMFRGRVMVPLMDGQGQVIGFTARLLNPDDTGPKYINTPATSVYDKSRHVYGLSQAKQAIRNSNYVVVVEGNLDVISSHQAGYKQVVATAGTAMTSQQFSQLKRFTGDVRLSFDADRAGQAAAERAIPLAQAAGVTLSIVTIPEGKDPDELVRKDAKLWAKAIEQPDYAVDWLIAQYQKTLDTTSAVGKRRLTDVVLGVVRKLQDPVEQDHYLQVIAGVVGASAESLRAKLAYDGSKKPLKRHSNEPTKSSLPEYDKRAQHFVAIMLLRPAFRTLMADLPDDMFGGDVGEVYKFLQKTPEADAASIGTNLKELADCVKILVLLAEEGYGRTEPDELRYQTELLRSLLVADYVRTKKQLLAAQMNESGSDQEKLIKTAQELDSLISKFAVKQ